MKNSIFFKHSLKGRVGDRYLMFLLTPGACAELWVGFFPFGPDKINDTGTAGTWEKVQRLLAASCIIYFKVDLKGEKKKAQRT